MTTVTIIGSAKGGVGATNFATLFSDLCSAAAEGHLDSAAERAAAAAQQGPALQDRLRRLLRLRQICISSARDIDVLSVDYEIGGQTQSALRHKIRGVIPVTLGPSIEQQFEMLARDIMAANTVVDFGPGVLGPWLAWAARTEFGRKLCKKEIRLDFVTVATADRAALGLSADVLTRADETFRRFSVDFQGYVALNEVVSGFESVHVTTEWRQLNSALKQIEGAKFLTVPRFRPELQREFETSQLRPTQIAAMTSADIERTWEVNASQATRSGKDNLDWVLATSEQMLAAGLLEAPDEILKEVAPEIRTVG